MRITCPVCHFARELPEDKIPAKAQVATCPKCKHKFRFRALPPEAFAPLADRPAPAKAQDTPSPDSGPQDAQARNAQPQGSGPSPEPIPPLNETSGGDIWDRLGNLRMEERDRGPATPPAEDPFGGGQERPLVDVPFERLDQYGFFPGLIQTVRRAMFSPQLFFGAMPLRGLGRPLIFAVLVSQMAAFFQILWERVGILGQPPAGMDASLGLSLAVTVVLTPILVTILLFLESALFHFCLILFKVSGRGFEGTFRVMAYACAPLFLSFVPVIGPVVGSVWGLAVNFIGIKHMHGTSMTRVAGAFVLFLAVILGVVGFMAFAVNTIPPVAR